MDWLKKKSKNWKYIIRVPKLDEGSNIVEKANKYIDVLNNFKKQNEDNEDDYFKNALTDVIIEFEFARDTNDVDDFDSALEYLYDFGDDYAVWIEQ